MQGFFNNSWQMTLADEKQEVASQWRSAEIKVDGSDAEWTEAVTYLEKEKLGFGLKNDSSAFISASSSIPPFNGRR